MENGFVIEIKVSDADGTPRQLCGTILELSDEDLGDFYYEILARIMRNKDFSQAEDTELTVKRFADTMDVLD